MKKKNLMLSTLLGIILAFGMSVSSYASPNNPATSNGVSGVNEYWYVLNGVESTHQTSNDFTLTENGTYTFYVSDYAGNITSEELVVDWIDVTEPIVTLTQKDEFSKVSTQVTFNISDNMALEKVEISSSTAFTMDSSENGTISSNTVTYSYVDEDKSTYKTDDEIKITVTENGTFTIKITDVAGNVKTENLTVTKIDKLAPSISSLIPSATKWISDDDMTIKVVAVDATATLTDTCSGIEEYSMDGTNWQTSNVFTVYDNGTYTFYAKDKAGNVSASKSITVSNFDRVKPEITSVVYSSLIPQQIITATLTSTAGLSNVKSYRYVMEDGTEGAWQTSNVIDIPQTGVYKFQSLSNSGVISDAYEDNTQLWVDRTAPTVSAVQYTKQGVTYVQKEEIFFDLSDNYSVQRWELRNSNGDILDSEIFFNNEINTSADFVSSVTTKNICIYDNGTYELEAVDVANNSYIKTFVINTIDNTAPTITTSRTSQSATEVKQTLVMNDNHTLAKVEISCNGTVINTIALSGTSQTKTLTFNNNGTYVCTLYDEAGNVSEAQFLVTNIIKDYTLDEDASLFHVHYGTANGKTPSGCYDETYQSWEVVGYHNEGSTCNGYATYCGHYTCEGFCVRTGQAVCPGHDTFYDQYGHPASGVGGCSWSTVISVPDYGWVTRYTCNKLDQALGYITLRKVLNGEYVLAIEDNTNSDSEIVSYLWTGRDTTNVETPFPSVHPNGGDSTTINGQTTSEVVIPDFGYYTCTVTYKDKLSGATYKVKFYYMVEDYDLEPPVVVNIKRSYSEYAVLAGADFDKIVDDTIVDGNDVVGFEDNDVTVTIDGNDINPYEVEEEIQFELSDNMSLNYIECVETGVSYTFADTDKTLQPDGTMTAVISDIDLGLTKFDANGTYHFKLFDMILNEYDFTVDISRVDDGTVDIKAVASTPSSETLSNSYVLKVSSISYSPMYYQFIRMWEDDDLNPQYEVYKDWSDESFCEITDNGYFAVKVANSSLTKDVINDETDALKLYDKEFVKIWTFNGDFNNYKLTYSLCDTTAPSIADLKIKATADMVIVTVVAKDDYSDVNNLTYTCDKAYKQKDNVFYITTNGYYKFTVVDECGNTSEKTIYIDLSDYGLDDYGIVKDIEYDYLGTTYKAEGKTYTDTGINVTAKYMNDVDESKILTKIDEGGTYKNLFTYQFLDNGSYTLFTRNTAFENENIPEVLYKDKLSISTIDKTAPSVSIEVKDSKAYITATDEISGIGGINVLTTTIANSKDDRVDYSGSRKTSVTYILPLEYNVIQTISVYDNVGNQSTEYSISTDGVLKGGFKDLFVVIFIDSNKNVLSEQILLKGANAVAPNVPNRDGFTFENWSSDFTNVSRNMTVYPVYRSNTTKELDLEVVELDKSWHIALLGHSFAYSTGGDSNIANLESQEVKDSVIKVTAVVEDVTSTITLSDYATPLTIMQNKVYTYCGLSLVVMLLLIYVFNKIQEKRMLKKERL